MKNAEDRLQYEIVTAFGQKYPQFRNHLIEINNNTTSAANGVKRKAMGMVAGASDLLFISPFSTTCIFIELKAENTKHKTSHIERQLTFGADMVKSGHLFVMTTSRELVIDIIDFLINKKYELALQHMFGNEIWLKNYILPQLTKKTINF